MSTPNDIATVQDALVQSLARQRNAAMDQIAQLEAALYLSQKQLQTIQSELTKLKAEAPDAATVS